MVPEGVQVLVAPNPGPFTLDGTRSYVVGRRRIAVIDPGPSDPRHLEQLLQATSAASAVSVLVTHDHADHAEAAGALGRELGAPILGATGAALSDGYRIETDVGTLIARHTPGHTEEHWTLHWPQAQAAFVGDLLLGQGNTTWIGEYAGGVRDYLASLETLRDLATTVLFPGHGEPILDPGPRIDLFEEHRRGRISQVRRALEADPSAGASELLTPVYGDLPAGLRPAAVQSIAAILDYLREPE